MMDSGSANRTTVASAPSSVDSEIRKVVRALKSSQQVAPLQIVTMFASVIFAVLVYDLSQVWIVISQGNGYNTDLLFSSLSRVFSILFSLSWTYLAWQYVTYLIQPLSVMSIDPVEGKIYAPNSELFYMLIVFIITKSMYNYPEWSVLGAVIILFIHKYKSFEIWSRILTYALKLKNVPRIGLLYNIQNFFFFKELVQQDHKDSIQNLKEHDFPKYQLFSIAEKWNRDYSTALYRCVYTIAVLFITVISVNGILAFFGGQIRIGDFEEFKPIMSIISFMTLLILTVYIMHLLTTTSRRPLAESIKMISNLRQ